MLPVATWGSQDRVKTREAGPVAHNFIRIHEGESQIRARLSIQNKKRKVLVSFTLMLPRGPISHRGAGKQVILLTARHIGKVISHSVVILWLLLGHVTA